MAELITLARPYAKAAFEVALQDKDLDGWSKMLGLSAALSADKSVNALLSSPALAGTDQAQALIDVGGDEFVEKGQNFIHLLAQNKRLPLLPQISNLFEEFKANQEKTVDVEVTTAFEVSPEIAEKLAKALSKRLQREIKLETSVDKGLIGGAVIRAGDSVIDSSVRGKLTKLAESMNS